MTNNYIEFKNYCIEKFGRVGNFALLTTNKSSAYNGFINMEDSEKNRKTIDDLLELAKKTPCDKSKIFISVEEARDICKRVDMIVESNRLEGIEGKYGKYKESDFLKKCGVDQPYYSNMIARRIIKKSGQYHKLVKALGL